MYTSYGMSQGLEGLICASPSAVRRPRSASTLWLPLICTPYVVCCRCAYCSTLLLLLPILLLLLPMLLLLLFAAAAAAADLTSAITAAITVDVVVGADMDAHVGVDVREHAGVCALLLMLLRLTSPRIVMSLQQSSVYRQCETLGVPVCR